MTPQQEEAIRLIKKFVAAYDEWTDEGFISEEQAKQCAIIHIELTLEYLHDYSEIFDENIKFLNEVKIELEKI